MTISRRDALLSGLVATAAGSLPATAAVVGTTADPRRPGERPIARRGDLGDGTYLNPVLPGEHPDPSILKDGEVYYQVASSFIYYPGLVIWRSTDLVTWSPVGPALFEPVGSVYAPDLVKHDGRYYIYFPARSQPQMPAAPGQPPRKPMTNYVVHADRIEGPWSEPIDLGIYNQIDPGHVVGEDGKRYLYVSDGILVPLQDDGLHRSGSDEKRYDGWRYPADWAVETFALEGPKFVRRDGWFYMFSAVGGTAGPPTSHMVIVARSRSVRGPWENCPHNPIVHTAAIDEPWWSRGHATAVEGPRGDWWLLYHGYENGYRTLGRQGLLEPMRWTADGWPQATGGTLSRPLPTPTRRRGAPAPVVPRSLLDPKAFGAPLSLFKPGRDYRDRVRFGAEQLTLRAQGKTPADTSPLVINASDHRYEVTADIALSGTVTAGLLLFYNEKFFCGIAADGRELHAYNLGAENAFEARTRLAATALRLKLVNEDQVGRFYTSVDGGPWVLQRSYEVAGYNHNVAGGYLSLRPAVFAAGTGEVTIRTLAYRAF